MDLAFVSEPVELDDPVPLPGAEAACARLALQARADLAALAYPERAWIAHRAQPDVHDVVIVGGGQSGLGISAMLKTHSVINTVVLDRSDEGAEGVWETFARMPELRTPKVINGLDLGCASLAVHSWYRACYGVAAWEAIDRIPRRAWMNYLRWYRRTLGVPIRNRVDVLDVRASADPAAPVAVDIDSATDGRQTLRARAVVLATGLDGGGAWRVPEFIAAQVPRQRYDHSNGPIDFSRLRDKRIGILGHGASAFDNAVSALSAGAASVQLCFRRARLPRINPNRAIETAGMASHYPLLSDASRWAIARHFRAVDQPPPRGSFRRALALPGFTMIAGCGWLSARMQGDTMVVESPKGPLHFDHLILATGLTPDLSARAEMSSLASRVARWADRYEPPPADRDDLLASYPYLGADYQFLPREVGAACAAGIASAAGAPSAACAPSSADADWVSNVYAFNGASYVSCGPHSTSISGHKYALPRLVKGITRRLFLDQESSLLDRLRAYDEIELDLPEDFEA